MNKLKKSIFKQLSSQLIEQINSPLYYQISYKFRMINNSSYLLLRDEIYGDLYNELNINFNNSLHEIDVEYE